MVENFWYHSQVKWLSALGEYISQTPTPKTQDLTKQGNYMNKKEILSIILLILVLGFAWYRYQNKIYTYADNRILMDTIVSLKFETKTSDVNAQADSVFKLIQYYENKLSTYKEDSYVWNINNAEVDSFAMDADVYEILTRSEKLFLLTNKKYDVTIGEIADLWDFENEVVPTDKQIKEAQKTIGFDRVKFNEKYLIKPRGMKINLGSVAKGFILDKVAEHLESRNVISGYVNAGGDIRFFGNQEKQSIGIRHPRKGDIIGTIAVNSGSVVTSGDYERFFIKDNRRYHHIIDPITGYPADNSVSITVIADNGEDADIFSTALFLLKPEKAIELAEKFDNVEAIIYYIDNDKIKNIKTTGMKNFLIEENL
jgi:thiamine biosynthesis lipoprotein